MADKTDYREVTVCRNDLCTGCRPSDRIWWWC